MWLHRFEVCKCINHSVILEMKIVPYEFLLVNFSGMEITPNASYNPIL